MRRHVTCLATLGLALALCGTGRANLITNGSFEANTLSAAQDAQPFVTLGTGSTAITGWTVTGGSIDYIGSYWQASNGSRSIDLDGNSPGGLTASTSLSVTAGTTYYVQFDMAGNPDGLPTTKSLTASAGGVSQVFTFTVNGQTEANMGWKTMSFSFKAATTGSTTLSFVSNDNGSPYGPALDNVVVSVPEPATLAMCGTSLLAVTGVLLRRKSKAAQA